MRARVAAAWVTAGILGLAAVAGGVVAWQSAADNDYEVAVAVLPAWVQRVSFTDWTRARDLAAGSGLSASSSPREVARFLERAYDLELTTASALSDATAGLSANLGISPLGSEWEIYGQGEQGAVSILRVADSVDLDQVGRRLRENGYARQKSVGGNAVLAASVDELAALAEPLGPLQSNVALVPGEHLVVMSDEPASVTAALAVIAGAAPGVDGQPHVSQLVAASGEPSAAVLWVGDLACADRAMSLADAADQSQADQLIARAGGVHPLAGLVIAQQPGSDLVVAMAVEEGQAAEDLQARTDLAAGDAPGQGGTFGDRFKVTAATASDEVVKLELEVVDGPVLSDLQQGPLLFAAC